MLERQRSFCHTQMPSNKNKALGLNRRACLQRQKSRILLLKRQMTCQSLLNTSQPCDTNNNNNNNDDDAEDDELLHASRVSRLLLKHTKFGFIKSFASLSINNPDETIRVAGESDQLVQKFPTPGDLLQEPEISSKIINKEAFEIGLLLGSGGFGTVYLGVYNEQKVYIIFV